MFLAGIGGLETAQLELAPTNPSRTPAVTATQQLVLLLALLAGLLAASWTISGNQRLWTVLAGPPQLQQPVRYRRAIHSQLRVGSSAELEALEISKC